MNGSISRSTAMRESALPDHFVLEIVLPKYLIQHDLNVMGGVPVAVVVERPRLFQDSCDFHATRTHVLDVSFCRFVSVLKGPLLLGLAPKNFVVAIRVERRIDVAKVYAVVRELPELIEAVAAMDDASIDERRGAEHLLNVQAVVEKISQPTLACAFP